MRAGSVITNELKHVDPARRIFDRTRSTVAYRSGVWATTVVGEEPRLVRQIRACSYRASASREPHTSPSCAAIGVNNPLSTMGTAAFASCHRPKAP